MNPETQEKRIRELLEALLAYVQTDEYPSDPLHEKARAAIAKATGGQS